MKKALVIGASCDLGCSVLKKFNNKYQIIATYFNNEDKLKEYIKENNICNIDISKLDINNEELVSNFIKDNNDAEILINLAAISIDNEIKDKDLNEFKEVINTNLCGTYNVLRNYCEIINKGVVVNISSTNAIYTHTKYSCDYDASKAAINSLMKSFTNSYPSVRINTICPGWINTSSTVDLYDKFKEKEIKKIILGRFAEPEEIANVINFMSSDESSYINNAVINVDGGIYE